METDNKDSIHNYTTPDLALAATISLWEPIIRIDKTNPRRAKFFFRQSEYLKNLVDSFWKGKLRVEPRVYFNQLKSIKSQLYG